MDYLNTFLNFIFVGAGMTLGLIFVICVLTGFGRALTNRKRRAVKKSIEEIAEKYMSVPADPNPEQKFEGPAPIFQGRKKDVN